MSGLGLEAAELPAGLIRVEAKICELCGRQFFRAGTEIDCPPCKQRLRSAAVRETEPAPPAAAERERLRKALPDLATIDPSRRYYYRHRDEVLRRAEERRRAFRVLGGGK